MARIRLGDLLIRAGLIDDMQLQAALAQQRQWGGKLGDILVDKNFLDEMMLWRGLSKQLGVPLVSLPELKLPADIVRQLPADLCERYDVFPIARDDRTLTVATSDPNNVGGLDEVAFRTGLKLKVVLSPSREIQWALRHFHHGDSAACPPPKTKRNLEGIGEPTAPPPPPAPGAFAGSATATPPQELFAARPAPAPAQPSWPPQPGTGGGAFAPPPYPGAPPQAGFSGNGFGPPGFGPPGGPASQMGFTQPPRTNTGTLEAELARTTEVLRFLVEACIARGIFSREEYLARLQGR